MDYNRTLQEISDDMKHANHTSIESHPVQYADEEYDEQIAF